MLDNFLYWYLFCRFTESWPVIVEVDEGSIVDGDVRRSLFISGFMIYINSIADLSVKCKLVFCVCLCRVVLTRAIFWRASMIQRCAAVPAARYLLQLIILTLFVHFLCSSNSCLWITTIYNLISWIRFKELLVKPVFCSLFYLKFFSLFFMSL